MTSDEMDLEGYRQAAAGAQRLAESLDILLPALILIAAGKADSPKQLAESTLQEFEQHRGQQINRAAVMRSKSRADTLKAGAALAAKRAAGV